MLVYGPVPSRRLGRSLGLNNIPYKYCSYSCIYCQVGRTTKMRVEPSLFYQPEALLLETKSRIEKVGLDGHQVEYISFVPDGEPTLDLNLGELVSMLKKELTIPVAIITNGSLLWREEVAQAASLADWVSVKVDSVVEPVWRRINRPDRRLELSKLLEGIRSFASGYRGDLVTETMLVENVNTNPEDVVELAHFLSEISPGNAYISVPSRPPAEAAVRVPAKEKVDEARLILEDADLKVECLTNYEGDQFTVTADAEQDILSIAAVHPLREDALRRILERSGADWQLVEKMVAEGHLHKNIHNQKTYYRTV
jgi:wyosine [tRNA(Phe)-imidazoG37] synthetase (radical SAM superfamily)